jgi:hypothetical protein
VTFDNWYSMGYGVDVLAIYDDKGMLLKRHMLEDISPFPINTYEMSIKGAIPTEDEYCKEKISGWPVL